ncbi:transglutaminase-like protein [Aeromicrobium marinum DSM 15272]|uniref:Transglutaminase-like protein n=1 Tax=Aeromicrobium marinum DSM 15272 TaxID=585531 RepID=E2SD59_9ACTN|nr:transglutaminase family protein [Aeromicrobium marinum]EFQ83162.1 transglutaminase-like protein [Aeromicrobium marinum DSM 15272]
MSIKVSLEHRTTYRFDRPVRLGPHVVRLRPAPHARTPIEAYSLDVQPADHFLNWQQDPFGNWMARLVFPEPVSTLDITVGLVADLMVINPFDFFIEEYAERFPFAYEPQLAADLAPYLRPVTEAGTDGPGPVVTSWLAGLPEVGDEGLEMVPFLVQVNEAVHRDVAYSVRMEAGVQSPDETLTRRIGSCRDSAWLLVSVLRQYGLAARFVSGYLVQLATDPLVAAQALDGPTGATEDFTDLHAWAEVYVPGAGWIGLDPTSALFAGEGHIPLSATPHPASAAPIEGVTEPVEVSFAFHNEVRRVHEDPRVTLPYTDQQWERIDDVGRSVDDRLVSGDVRLTMGGEPTFVSVDDMTSEQWTTDADGEDKRRLAGELAERLRTVYAAGGAVHRGQGKWYPGEPLPRWQIALQWRTDGEPLWPDPDLLADPWDPSAALPDASDRAERLARAVTAAVGVPDEWLLAAWEDPLAVLAAEVRRPEGDRPDTDPMHPGRDLVEALDAAETGPSGWVLPLATGEQWRSPAWSLRRGRLVLTPGDSAVGLRLPLDSITWTDPRPSGDPSYLAPEGPVTVRAPRAEVVDPEDEPTTALAFEARDGFVHVFLPPTERLEDYAELLALVGAAAVEHSTPVVLEGYGPPPDPRLTQLIVTPDPGVIEVNVQPTRSWAEMRALTDTLYDAARRTRLGTEKFDLDGSHTGTGGGNHITLGGIEPAQSPLLRRPDLLVSLLTYWQRHPSLSYLFSGRFIGPTSQAPRFDEGRPEATYEMEIAFQEIRRLSQGSGGHPRQDGPGEPAPSPRPWLVDRALRHLLTDLTGNTHRAEFCIDKMYSPDSSRGRLGLLELRGFEMPPHPQMAMVQALLVRALVAMFWEKPLVAPLVRWGTGLHEDFLLPRGVARDIAAVVADLQAHGIDFEQSWLDPFVEFRFPRLGQVHVDTASGPVDLELRAGIEPWHVLGEESASGGTARYVDSSVERLQVAVGGIDLATHLVACNGVPVPLTPTGVPGEYYAGVRYRAWQPWSALHPSIEVQSPLRFDVVDRAAGVSLGGCTYHVVHPGGRSYDHPPVNAASAEARRSSRFETRGHTPGRLDVAAMLESARQASSTEYPRTLDLRRVPPAGPRP